MTVGQAIEELRIEHGLLNCDLEQVMRVNSVELAKIKRGKKELSFLMGVRLLEYFGLSMDEFCSLLSVEELNRKELATIRNFEKEELRRSSAFKLKPLEPADVEQLSGKELMGLVMGHIQKRMK